ncbi:tryptophan synthase subunit alpha [Alkalilimnicola ehrlichii MLHE-1]|uniref:Tryptophan synthase alpha chain n=1 Tax=Alkalilimnicola ehrlichii (strain ATCC BAA-1101 / DSM 17681 / MLHE-1) TaxID=187272 RepID=TRPA_ALKEH|nr:tryptophan synthase subunit alpha [Alkalilimnicola ehrlichii]Q0A9A1.1 RecName: Full=Tryptophan synthase alpha chain [Alkalilimnicola ehrlichii MLHE-1]ABI56586.1 tryptophan synthase, alpha chain [Alkalilimnicola ehrlichii MLHE-1]
MNRLEKRMSACRKAGRKALIPYITAGDPGPEHTVPLMHALVGAGADVLELGVPFSDPMADGPVIQAACERALAHGTTLRDVFDMVRRFREQDGETPVVLMGYLNPVEYLGPAVFAEEAAAAGVDGVLTVDLPPEEAAPFTQAFAANDLCPIFLVAPTTAGERLEAVCQAARGFVYYVAIKGVTGVAELDVDDIARRVSAVRARTDLPVGVGFGIRDAESAARVGAVADAVIVGSALVNRIAGLTEQPERVPAVLAEALGEMRRALDGLAEEVAS